MLKHKLGGGKNITLRVSRVVQNQLNCFLLYLSFHFVLLRKLSLQSVITCTHAPPGRLEAESSRWRQSNSWRRWWIWMLVSVRTSPKRASWLFVPTHYCLRSFGQCVTRRERAWFCPSWVRMYRRLNGLRRDTSSDDVKTANLICKSQWRKNKGGWHQVFSLRYTAFLGQTRSQ